MARKKLNLNTALQTDGKIRSEEDSENPQYQPTTLSQLFGETNGSERYGTLDIEVYKNTLEGFNSAELRRHAIEVAHVVPAVSSERTIKRLVLEFQKYTAGFTMPRVTHKKDKEPSKEALRIMAECK
jgi:hypothetical protein